MNILNTCSHALCFCLGAVALSTLQWASETMPGRLLAKSFARSLDIRPVRTVLVSPMCRCNSGKLPVPGGMSVEGHTTSFVQTASIATGAEKEFSLRSGTCKCQSDVSSAVKDGLTTSDKVRV